MASKVYVMKKDASGKKDKNLLIWENFVLKNGIKKKFQIAAALVLAT